jgi:hypothetical protein
MELCYVVVPALAAPVLEMSTFSSSADPEKYQNYKGRDAGRLIPPQRIVVLARAWWMGKRVKEGRERERGKRSFQTIALHRITEYYH